MVPSWWVLILACGSVENLDHRVGDPAADRDRILTAMVKSFVTVTPGTGMFPQVVKLTARELRPEPFSIQSTEVTQEQAAVLLGDNPSRWRGPKNAVDSITYAEAEKLAAELTKFARSKNLIAPNQSFALPSAEQWEYACRAGQTTAYEFGDNAATLGEFAWYDQNAAGNDPPVGAKRPSRWGLYDMHGYVWEWCQPAGDTAGNDGLVMGGAWTSKAADCRCASRLSIRRSVRRPDIGARLVLNGVAATDSPNKDRPS